MPYSVKKRNEKFCVIKDPSGESMGCHGTPEEARSQIRALYANEPSARESSDPYFIDEAMGSPMT